MNGKIPDRSQRDSFRFLLSDMINPHDNQMLQPTLAHVVEVCKNG